MILTPGQASDIGQAEALLADHEPEVVIADKAYDKKALVQEVEGRGAAAVIPTPKDRTVQRPLDRHTYKERNLAERFWAQASSTGGWRRDTRRRRRTSWPSPGSPL